MKVEYTNSPTFELDELSTTKTANLNTDVNTLMTSLGRNV